jgi:hypothetical protein
MMEGSENSAPGEQKIPIIVEESLDYLRKKALSQVDMAHTVPKEFQEPELATSLQLKILVESIKDLRSAAIIKGSDEPVKKGGLGSRLTVGQYNIVSTKPGFPEDKGKVFWISYSGEEEKPDIKLEYFVGEPHKFSIQVTFKEDEPNEPGKKLAYKTGVEKRDEMLREEYDVASFIVEGAIKLVKPPEKSE